MSWGTYYRYEGELRRIAKNEIDRTIEEKQAENKDAWNRIKMLIAMTPAPQKDYEGHDINWIDYIEDQIKDLQELIEDNDYMLARLYDAQTAMAENPKNVHDDNDSWNEDKDDWADLFDKDGNKIKEPGLNRKMLSENEKDDE